MELMLQACGCWGGVGAVDNGGWWRAMVIVGIGEEQTFQVGSEVRLGEGEGRIGMTNAAGSEERGMRKRGTWKATKAE